MINIQRTKKVVSQKMKCLKTLFPVQHFTHGVNTSDLEHSLLLT